MTVCPTCERDDCPRLLSFWLPEMQASREAEIDCAKYTSEAVEMELDRVSKPLREAVEKWKKPRTYVGGYYRYSRAKRVWLLDLTGAVDRGYVSLPRITVEVSEDGTKARVLVSGKWRGTTKSPRGLRSILDRIEKNVIGASSVRKLVLEFFQNNIAKTDAWMSAPNPTLGGAIPNDLISIGQRQKLLEHVQALLEENKPSTKR